MSWKVDGIIGCKEKHILVEAVWCKVKKISIYLIDMF